MHRFPGLEPFTLSDEELAIVEDTFELVLKDARLGSRNKEEIRRAIPDAVNVPGVYFWSMSLGQHSYRIYVGKTKSLERRVSEYMKDFQAHSPNDYKIRIFQQAILDKERDAAFKLYFLRASLSIFTQLENEMVRRYDPLLNRRASVSQAARDAFRDAFEAYYRAGFEAVLAR